MKQYIKQFYTAALLLLLSQGLMAQFRMPAYTTYTLKNGLTVYLLEQHEVPVVNVNLVWRGGWIQDGDKPGLTEMVSRGLVFGTPAHTRTQIESAFENAGASMGAGSGKEQIELGATLMKRDLGTLMPYFAGMAMQSTFPEDEFGPEKERYLQELEMSKESPRECMPSYRDAFLYGSHPYAHVQGTPAGVRALSAADLRAYFADRMGPENAALILTGDFVSAEMKKQVESWFGGWKKGKTVVKPIAQAPALDFKESRVLLVNKDDSRETRFLIAAKGVPFNHPDFVAISVVNTVLGGRFTSWLNDALRVNAGLTYGAGSSFPQYGMGGLFVISSFTKTSTTTECIDLALHVLDSLHTTGIDAKTLASAKNYILGGFPPDYETGGQLADLLGRKFLYGFDDSFINEFQNRVNAVTVEKAREIVAKYFTRTNLQFILIGKAADIRDKVKKYGKVTEKNITAEGY